MLVVRQPPQSCPFAKRGDTVVRSPAITIHVGTLRGTDPLPTDGSILLAFEANLRIEIDDRVWFEEPDFPVLELAVAIHAWRRSGGSLHFDSMEASESPFLTIERLNGDCRLSAAWQSYPESRLIPGSHVEAAFSTFAVGVLQSVRSQFGVDASTIADGP